MEITTITLSSLIGGNILDKRQLGIPVSRVVDVLTRQDTQDATEVADKILASGEYTLIFDTRTFNKDRSVENNRTRSFGPMENISFAVFAGGGGSPIGIQFTVDLTQTTFNDVTMSISIVNTAFAKILNDSEIGFGY